MSRIGIDTVNVAGINGNNEAIREMLYNAFTQVASGLDDLVNAGITSNSIVSKITNIRTDLSDINTNLHREDGNLQQLINFGNDQLVAYENLVEEAAAALLEILNYIESADFGLTLTQSEV